MVVVCGARTTPGVLSQSYDHIPVDCKPFDRALNVYFNEYVKVEPTVWYLCHSQLALAFLPRSSRLSHTPGPQARG